MRESTLWFLHLISGIVILVVLGIHLGVMHLDDILVALGIGYSDVLSYNSMLERAQSLFHTIVYLILLGAALFHGLYGFRSMLYELPLKPALERTLGTLITLVGLLLFAYGAYVIIVGFVSLGG